MIRRSLANAYELGSRFMKSGGAGQPADPDDTKELSREAEYFSRSDNRKVRSFGWGSIPYFQQKLLEKLDLVAEARKFLGKRAQTRALTLACGDMTGEYALFKKLNATHIDAFDISEGQRDKFHKNTYDGKIPVEYGIRDVNRIELPEGAYDVICMQQSLHHIEEVEAVLLQVEQALRPDGVFLLSDYVGEPFLQRGPKQRAFCQRLWPSLPARLRTTAAGYVLKQIHIPKKEALSPFEAIRSDAILPALDSTFTRHVQILFGGVLFPMVNGFAMNYDLDNETDSALVKLLWELDEIAVEQGLVEPTFVRGIYGPKRS